MLYMYLFNTILVQFSIYEYFYYLYQPNYKNVFALVTLILRRGLI